MSSIVNTASADEWENVNLTCPITGEKFIDPVIDKEGNTYERSAIIEWLQTSSTSPITRSPLSLSDLIPNRQLQALLNPSGNGIVTPSSSPTSSPDASRVPRSAKVTHTIAPLTSATSQQLAVTITPPPADNASRTPSHIVLCIDVSGSMDSVAAVKGGESSGLTVLDVVKHSCKTVVKLMNPTDIISVVKYSTSAQVVSSPKFMTDANRSAVLSAIESLHTEGSTNIWDGLRQSMDLINVGMAPADSANVKSHVFLLTDGLPNIIPPRGHLPMLSRYFDANPNFSADIHTFGFGYNLDSKLLLELAIKGKGGYSFIPDSGFVGTTFCHSVANVLTSCGNQASLCLELPENIMLTKISGSAKDFTAAEIEAGTTDQLQFEKTSWGVRVDVGMIQYGQPKTFIFNLDSDSNYNNSAIGVSLKYSQLDGSVANIQSITLANAPDGGGSASSFSLHRLRAVEVITKVLELNGWPSEGYSPTAGTTTEAKSLVMDLCDDIKSKFSDDSGCEKIKALLADLEGQVTEAVSSDEYWNKWGRHYLPALCRAYLNCYCTNFKDVALQKFTTPLFEKLRDEADAVFMSIPPPTPSRGGARMSMATYSRTYNNYSNPCFDGNCVVLMANGNLTRVMDVRKGDIVSGGGKVLCVVKTLCKDEKTELVKLGGGLFITPYHPVRVEGVWTFPKDINSPVVRSCPAVYSFCLDSRHSMIINGVECVTLGHNFTDNEVIRHEYFGSQRVIDDLKKFRKGWAAGLITMNFGAMKRGIHNDTDTTIIGFEENRVMIECM